jgi:hypothetical protein
MKLLIITLLLSSVATFGKELFRTENLYIEYLRTMSERDYRLPESNPSLQRLNFGMRTDLGKRFYVESRVVSAVDERQFRMVGLESDIGVEIVDNIDIFYRHSSYHILDMARDN